MTTRTLRRGAPVRRPAVKRRGKPRQSRLDALLSRLPVDEATIRRWATRGILATGGAAVLLAAVWAGVPATVGAAIGEAAGRAGLRYDEVQAEGNHHLSLVDITAVVKEQGTRSLPLLDLGEVRRRLLTLGWVKDAQVSRRYPNKVLVRIVERVPAATWQFHGQLKLVDADGVILDDVDRNAMPDLPLLIGPDANRQAPSFHQLMAAAPALRPRVAAATWVENRRWNLRFDSGETLKLPEEGAGAALLDFAKRDGAHPLLGRGWLSFDLRLPGKMVVRRPPTGAERQVADPAQPAGAGGNGMEG
ncbi:cell division protein FtsQ/DivIB [Sphingomonas sp.]|uniref:cell division protein FtsQ/DivIB n=1 Tax=Sphingomonas sp. TaxID=28214 RepID=UPI003CC57770